MVVHVVTQVQVPAKVFCTSWIQKLFVTISLCVCLLESERQKVQTQPLFITVENFWCVNNFSNMDFFLVIIHNLEFASSDMLDLCTKYLIGMFNYTPCPHIIIDLPLFSPEQIISAETFERFGFSIIIVLASASQTVNNDDLPWRRGFIQAK